jgi:hypothetical protein
MCKTFIPKDTEKTNFITWEIFVRTMPLLRKGFYARTLLMKGMNTSYSLLLKVGGSVIYRVFNGEAFDLRLKRLKIQNCCCFRKEE